jgi:hypothetical protein
MPKKGEKHTPEMKAKLSKIHKARWADPANKEWADERKAKLQEARKNEDPEVRQLRSINLKNNWDNPRWKKMMQERQSQGAKKRWADPEKREALLAAQKKYYNKKKDSDLE